MYFNCERFVWRLTKGYSVNSPTSTNQKDGRKSIWINSLRKMDARLFDVDVIHSDLTKWTQVADNRG